MNFGAEPLDRVSCCDWAFVKKVRVILRVCHERRTANSLFMKARERTVGTTTPAGDRGLQKTSRGHRNVTKEAKVVEHLCKGNTYDSMDIGGTISPQWVRGGPKGLLGGVRPPKRCFLCGAQPRTTHCPRPCAEGQSRSKGSHGNGVNIDSHMHANSQTTGTVYFSHDLCKR